MNFIYFLNQLNENITIFMNYKYLHFYNRFFIKINFLKNNLNCLEEENITSKSYRVLIFNIFFK